MASAWLNSKTVVPSLALVVALAACGGDSTVASIEPVPSELASTEAETTSTVGPTTSTVPTTTTTTEMQNDSIDSSWLDGVDVQIVGENSLDGGTSFLLRFDDEATIDLAEAIGRKAEALNISDDDGVLASFSSPAWLDAEWEGANADAMDLLLNGGLFGEYNPDPTSGEGHVLMVRVFAAEFGRESEDQREYLVGSIMRGADRSYERDIVDGLPSLSNSEYFATVTWLELAN